MEAGGDDEQHCGCPEQAEPGDRGRVGSIEQADGDGSPDILRDGREDEECFGGGRLEEAADGV